jgi:hypothetical protein
MKAITITAELADKMRLRCPEFEVKIAEDESFQFKCQEKTE